MNWSVKIDDIKFMVDLHLTEAKTITSVAKMLKMPSETLRKKFLREEGIHLHEYIYQRKVKLMKELLLNSDEPCFAVCYSVGLREDSGAKVFKKITDLTMQEFREKYKKNYELLRIKPSQKQRLHLLLAEAFCIDPTLEEISQESAQQVATITLNRSYRDKKPKQILSAAK
jgi:AraC-like DNA-binding protein